MLPGPLFEVRTVVGVGATVGVPQGSAVESGARVRLAAHPLLAQGRAAVAVRPSSRSANLELRHGGTVFQPIVGPQPYPSALFLVAVGIAEAVILRALARLIRR